MERTLAGLSADAFARNMRSANPSTRGRLLTILETVSEIGFEEVARGRVERLPLRKRESLFRELRSTHDTPDHPRSRRRNPATAPDGSVRVKAVTV